MGCDTERKHRDGRVGQRSSQNRIYPENPTIGTAVGFAFVRRGTIDENAPRNSRTRQRVDFDATPLQLEPAKGRGTRNGSINIVF